MFKIFKEKYTFMKTELIFLFSLNKEVHNNMWRSVRQTENLWKKKAPERRTGSKIHLAFDTVIVDISTAQWQMHRKQLPETFLLPFRKHRWKSDLALSHPMLLALESAWTNATQESTLVTCKYDSLGSFTFAA